MVHFLLMCTMLRKDHTLVIEIAQISVGTKIPQDLFQ